MLGVSGWGWLVEGGECLVGGGKIYMIRIDLITEFLWVKIDAKKRNC